MTGATHPIVVVRFYRILTVSEPRRMFASSVSTQCEPVGRYCEAAYADSVTECEPLREAVCKSTVRYVQAAKIQRRQLFALPPLTGARRRDVLRAPAPEATIPAHRAVPRGFLTSVPCPSQEVRPTNEPIPG